MNKFVNLKLIWKKNYDAKPKKKASLHMWSMCIETSVFIYWEKNSLEFSLSFIWKVDFFFFNKEFQIYDMLFIIILRHFLIFLVKWCSH